MSIKTPTRSSKYLLLSIFLTSGLLGASTGTFAQSSPIGHVQEEALDSQNVPGTLIQNGAHPNDPLFYHSEVPALIHDNSAYRPIR